MINCKKIKGWEWKRSKCFFIYIHLDLFRSHPQYMYEHHTMHYYWKMHWKFLGGWVLHHTNTVNVVWWLASCTGGGRPQVPLRALFQVWSATCVEPSTLMEKFSTTLFSVFLQENPLFLCKILVISMNQLIT